MSLMMWWLIYLDNVVILGRTLKKFGNRHSGNGKLTAASFMINVKKSDFLCEKNKMLGFIVGKGTVQPVAKQLDVIASEWNNSAVYSWCLINLQDSVLFPALCV